MEQDDDVRVVCLWAGGDDETSSLVLESAVAGIRHQGAEPEVLDLGHLLLPAYAAQGATDPSSGAVHDLVAALRRADGLLVAMSSDRGEIGAALRNAFDHAECVATGGAHLDGRGVGCIVFSESAGPTEAALVALRSMVHALQGWPMPMSSTLATSGSDAEPGKHAFESSCRSQVELVTKQVVAYARGRARSRNSSGSGWE